MLGQCDDASRSKQKVDLVILHISYLLVQEKGMCSR